ncbi:ComF family protein [Halopseudomonas salina]|uniref:Phosphoribosyltransferase n=1 Tax=Halopseudomonas salina TaxID=1323744 RepID=A0ABQ1Q2N0_9GAMM|nr:ComF family protein [Halopseudomonas salina]GGD10985.1 phosphoribosyltransferase [Halopseudomonas salina]
MNISQVYKWLINSHPSRCLLCLGDGAQTTSGICDACRTDLPWLHSQCRRCALPLPVDNQLCGKCQLRNPTFAQVVSPLLYRFPIDSLIPAFKYHDQLIYGRLLARLLAEAVHFHYSEHDQSLPDRVLPMPLHPKRQARRGFNQAQEIAGPVARYLQLPLCRHSLRRVRHTAAQQGLSANDRKRNLANAFQSPPTAAVTGLHLALVDDVVTTGTTADAASQTLIEAGAASVSIWCIARTP